MLTLAPPPPSLPASVLARLGALVLLAAAAQAQVAVSVDWQGPTIARADPVTGLPLTEADVLAPLPGVPAYGPLPTPRVLLSGDLLGLSRYSSCSGHLPGTPCGIELDALSHGQDALFTPAGTQHPGSASKLRLWFSVDEYAVGQGSGPATHPQVRTEAPGGDSSGDLFVDTGLPGGPLPPGSVTPSNAGAVDGDGLPGASGFVYPGVGLVEPNPPTGQLPNPGDNVDALDRGFPAAFPAGGVYFSLDGDFSDPLSGLPASASAAFESFSGADVLRTATPGGQVALYAPAALLGLDQDGPGTDDLDALILRDNGDGAYQPSLAPYDWIALSGAASTDMLVFSARRGSAVIGKPDSIFGLPIEEGDLLVPPLAGGLSPYPGIFVAAENLGLATVRSGTAALFGDDLDAADADELVEFDCNNNGVEDAVDIATGASSDANMNGIPDECESSVSEACLCPTSSAPCSNPDSGAGCANSTGSGGRLDWSGSTSVSADDLSLAASQLPLSSIGIVFMGNAAASVPFGDGRRCAGGQVFRYAAKSAGASGSFTLGPGLVSASCSMFPPAGCITSGATWHFQGWYRDPIGPCGSTFNLTNSLVVLFTP